MHSEIREQAFEPYAELLQYQQAMQAAGRYGATAVFVGSMRELNEGESVTAMELEHYPGMTEKYLQDISQHAATNWNLLDSLILHRVGRVETDDAIVLVAVWSAHRKDAFEASRYLMEELKSKAPFWKKEQTPEGERWVENNTAGY
ncbi:molybdenum cofactor biosynthesis protein MoaE [Thiohalophilus sp.]|uniref:molybdenum cofactor biosynthesis protein MoaE n=1 Tax=Thiohalophilus sp. TaxID=3028392 RepID=UPI002ACEEA53|nr:molybdenum cofactor biosynthesis protein MoaE [Thiohalophilus sp.]MDZ7805196.1 molybdenum cofactor biosynthesis protein MoaE [Thiohalophilus sp.]